MKHDPWPEVQEARVQSCHLKWRFIIEECHEAAVVGKQHHDAILKCKPDKFIRDIIVNAWG